VLVEGPEIEALLAQIRDEYGPGARIVSADKVRSGGVAGFFAKQHYEIAVEVDDGPAGTAPVAEAAPVTLLDLVEARRDQFGGEERSPAAPVPHSLPAPPEALPPRASLVSTTGSAFADVMAGLRAEGLATPSVAEANGNGAPTVRPYRPTVVPPNSVPVVPVVTTSPAVTTSPVDASPAPPVTVDTNDSVGAPPAVTTLAHPVDPPTRPWTARLIALGLPEDLANAATGADPYQAILAAFAGTAAPPTPPGRAGDIFVLVGEVSRALPLAREAARALRLDPDSVLLAASHGAAAAVPPAARVSGPPDAERRARRMHRADVPHVAVVDAPVDDTDPEWVKDVCDAFGATAVWAVVDATRKTADAARQLAGLGKVHGLAVYATAVSGDPASVLRVGPPVALLDGQPATAHAWAGLLSRRLLSEGEGRHGIR
jgi:hypothetical protein